MTRPCLLLLTLGLHILCASLSHGQRLGLGQHPSFSSRQLAKECLDKNGNPTKNIGCDSIDFSPLKITKLATKRGVYPLTSARQFYELETRINERLRSVERPESCRDFELFPKMIAKNGNIFLIGDEQSRYILHSFLHLVSFVCNMPR